MLARLMSQALRKLTACVSRSGTVLIFINQTRARLGVHFGNAETTTGGNALKFYSSVRCEIRRVGNLKDGEAVVGSRTKVKVLKNKVAPPFREAEFDVSYRTGIHRAAEVLDLALELGLVRKAGHSHSVDGVAIGNGREAAIEWLTQHPRELEALAAATVHHPGPRATSR
jgi:recombination protein RecA